MIVSTRLLDAKVEEVARALGLLDLGLDKDVTDLSGGQRTKVLLGKLLLEKPDILLLDEPLNHLSFQNSRVFNDVLNEVKAKNPSLTVIMISHCRAINFVDGTIQYNYDTEQMERLPYISYNCFDAE